MAPLLFVASTALEQLRLSALARAAERAGHPVTCLWPAQSTVGVEPARSSETLLRAIERMAPGWVITCGDGRAARTASLLCADMPVQLLRVDAGRRNHVTADRTDRQRASLDHAADLLVAATPMQAQNLRREHFPEHRVHVLGSTLLACRTPANRVERTASRVLRLCLRSAPQPIDPITVDRIHAAVAAGADAAELTVDVRDGFGTDPIAVLDGAAVLVTDDDDLQELAAIAGVPCVTVAPATTHGETLLAGCNRLAGTEPRAITQAIVASRNAPAGIAPYADAIPTLLALLSSPESLRASPTVTPQPRAAMAPTTGTQPIHLPSDADHSGRDLGAEELQLVSEALCSGTLNSTRGAWTPRFERAFAGWSGRRHAIACASGTAAVHAAIAALGLRPGDEVVTTPITDMGAIVPILYEGGVPVFADVDPDTLNVTAATLAARISERTRALIVTHLFGRPCPMAEIEALAAAHRLPIVEDVAQAFGATDRGRTVGTFGSIATWSLQQGKHMTTGEGGVVATDDDAIARRLFLFVNKAWGYGDPQPDHYFPALNYRLTELQSAVALAQLRKVDGVIARRRAVAAALAGRLAGIHGLGLPGDPPGGASSWWKYALRVDPASIHGGADALGQRLRAQGVSCVPRYIQKPAFECRLFTDMRQHPVSALPLSHSRFRDHAQPLFDRRDYPGAVRALDRVLVLPINEFYDERHVDHVAAAIRSAAAELRHD